MDAAEPLLLMQGIDKRFGGVPALEGASLEVAPGEVHALIGQNGAGKSTLIKILTGYYRRDAGTVRFGGRPLAAHSPQDAQAAGISTIYQEINLVGFRSVTENICLGRERRRFGLLDWQRMHEEARALLGRFGIGIDVRNPRRFLDRDAADGRDRARARLLRPARDHGRAHLIADRARGGVAVRGDRRASAEGVSVLFVSHKLDELYAVCDRVTIMRDGRTVRVADMADISKLDLVATMLGRDQSAVARTGHDRVRRQVVLGATGGAAGRSRRGAAVGASGDALRPRGGDRRAGGPARSGRTETVRALFGLDGATGRMRVGGAAYAPRAPRDAIAAGLGFCTEDRKAEGIVPDMSVRENLTLALLPALTRAGIVDERARRRSCPASWRASACMPRAGAADPGALGRQPAEGAARALAVQRAAPAAAGRADAGDRRGRQGGDPGAGPRARRRGAGRADGLVGTRGDRRGRGPRGT